MKKDKIFISPDGYKWRVITHIKDCLLYRKITEEKFQESDFINKHIKKQLIAVKVKTVLHFCSFVNLETAVT